jgi:beta-lactamase regulating signal transducer with metallopeptidase domain/protocatechuate 3,4-dioxygenase beta subunit/peroxiredoxin
MNLFSLFADLDRISFTAVQYLFSTLWQSGLLLGAIALLTWILRHRGTHIRYRLWLTAILLVPVLTVLSHGVRELAVPPVKIEVLPAYESIGVTDSGPEMLLTTPNRDAISGHTDGQALDNIESIPSAEAPRTRTAQSSTAVETVTTRTFNVVDYPWALAFGAYLLSVGAFIVWLGLAWLRIKGWIRRGQPIMDERVIGLFEAVRGRLDVRPVMLITHPGVPAPFACGVFQPVIVLPDGFAECLDDDELTAVAVHELTHIQHRHLQIFTGVSFIRAALFCQPLLWFAIRELSYLAERICDGAVVKSTGGHTSYAVLLTNLAKSLPHHRIAPEYGIGLVFTRSAFFRRVKAILAERDTPTARLTRIGLVLTGITVAMIVMVSLFLPLGQAQQPGTELTDTVSGTEYIVTGIVTIDGEPVSGGAIYILVPDKHTFSDGISRKVAESGADGTFSMVCDPATFNRNIYGYDVSLMCYHPEYAVSWVTLKKDTRDVEIELDAPQSISGTVTDPGGNPISGAVVKVSMMFLNQLSFRFSGLSALRGETDALMVTTGAGGEFSIGNLPPLTTIVLNITAEGRASALYMDYAVGSDDIQVQMDDEGAITGRVINGNGEPMENVRIGAHGVNTGFRRAITTRTDADGRYSIYGLVADTHSVYTILDELNGEQQWANTVKREIAVTAGETTEQQNIALSTAGILTGQFTDEDTGDPIPDVYIIARHPDRNSFIYFDTAVSDGTGTYTLRLPPGESVLGIRSVPSVFIQPDWQGRTVTVEDGSGPVTEDFPLKRGMFVRGKVVGPDGAPVANASVTGLMNMRNRNAWRGKVTTGDDGTFIISGLAEDATLEVEIASQEKKLRTVTTLTLDNSEEQPVTLEPYETTAFRGRVVDASDAPVPGVGIHLMIRHDGGGGLSRKMIDTDNDGRYVVENIRIGAQYSLSAKKEGWANADIPLPDLAPDMEPLPTVVMKQAGRWLELVVSLDDGTPITGAQVIINGGPSGFKRDVTGVGGTCRIEGLVPVVEPTISINHPEYGRYEFRYVETNTRHSFTMIKPKGSIAGKVVDADGVPVEGVHVHIDPMRRPSGLIYTTLMTDANGKFKFDQVIDDAVDIEFYHKPFGTAEYVDVRVSDEEQLFVLDKAHEKVRPERPGIEFDDASLVVLDDGAPALQVKQWITGDSIELSRYSGKVVVLDFWDSEVRSCIDRLRLMSALDTAYRGRGLVVIGIHASTGDPEVLDAIVKEHGITYPVAIDSESDRDGSLGATFDAFGIKRVSFGIVIGRDGEVTPDVHFRILEKTVLELLDEK